MFVMWRSTARKKFLLPGRWPMLFRGSRLPGLAGRLPRSQRANSSSCRDTNSCRKSWEERLGTVLRVPRYQFLQEELIGKNLCHKQLDNYD